MKPVLNIDYQRKNFDSIPLSWLIVIVLTVCSLFYLCICLGIYLSKITYWIADFCNKENLLKMIHFRRKFNFKNTIKFIFDYLVTSIIIWIYKVLKKGSLLGSAIWRSIEGLYFFLLLHGERIIKNNFVWKELFRDFIQVLLLFEDLYYVFISFIQEACFFSNLKEFFDSMGRIILFLLTNSILIVELISLFYLLLLCFFGVLIGFLYGLYNKKDELYILILLFLIRLMHKDELMNNLDLIQPNEAKPFVLPKVNPVAVNTFPKQRLFQKLNIDEQSDISLPILGDPFIWLEFDFVWDESQKYKFEFYRFYEKIRQ